MSAPLILTAGDRIARSLREDLNLAERAAHREAKLSADFSATPNANPATSLEVWEAPQVRSLRQWIGDVWADAWPTEQLLDGTQMQALWLAAVERDPHGVISTGACAREAREAERLTQDYAIDIEQLAAYSDEQRAWRGWRKRIARRMREQGWLSGEHLPAIVAAGLRDGRIVAPARIELAGFEHGVTPAYREVLDALRAVTQVDTRTPQPHADAPIQGYRCDDETAQLRLVAELIRRRLTPHADHDTLPPRIVVALPDPDKRRAALEDALIERVAPGLRSALRDDDSRARAPWRWDAAAPLRDSPWARAALAIVAVDAADNPPAAVSQLLLGAWFADAARHAAAAALDLRIRQQGRLRIGLRSLLAESRAPLSEALLALTTVIEDAPRRALPSIWSAHFAARLDAAGWPGVAAPPSTLFQTVKELRRAVAGLAALDAQTGAIDIGRARLWLGELLKRRFEPRAEHAQPVRLLALEDAIGIACDLLIVIDADTAAFPGPARSTPFLAIERQREAGIPAASPALWLTHRRAQLAALLGGAREVVAIAPKLDARGGEVLPSTLFPCAWQDAPQPTIISVAEQLAAGGAPTRMPQTDPVPPVSTAENLRGSTRLFEQYLAAPFFAFCAQRLGIEALPEIGRGLPAQLQGKLVHAALAGFWSGVKTRDGLRALDPAARGTRIDAALSTVLRQLLSEADYGRVLVRLETARLADVIGGWLTLESLREEDFEVIAHEHPIDATLGGLSLHLRIDRIERDVSLNGGLRLIDYKTGNRIDANGWREDALSAPQLPLYAVLLGELADERTVADIAFGHVADGAPKLLGWQRWAFDQKRQPVLHAGDFGAQRAAWRAALEDVVRGFLAGEAGLDADRIAGLRNEPLLALAGLIADDDAETAVDAAGEDA